MRILLAVIALLCFVDAQACQIHLPERIVLSGAVSNHCPFDQRDCAPGSADELCALIQTQDGHIPLQRLQAAVGEQVKLLSTANQIRVQRLAELVKAKYPQSQNVDMEISTATDGDIMVMNTNSEIELNCHPCLFNGSEAIRLYVKQFGGEPRNFNFSAKFSQHVMAARAKLTINAFATGLHSDQFEIVKVPQVAFGRYQTDLSKINFFKPNKTIRAGELLREGDLIPLTLVRAGDKVDLFFENDHVRLKSHATSRQNGGMGDKIEVWNQANGKKYRGVITDHNRVVVEL